MATVVWGQAAARKRVPEAELCRLVPVLRRLPGVREAWLFGSLAAGQVHAGSDIDLLVVRDTDELFPDRLVTLVRELEPKVRVDVFVYTPAEFETGAGYCRDAVRMGRKLW
jgi:predicted nucleotidyltransferase